MPGRRGPAHPGGGRARGWRRSGYADPKARAAPPRGADQRGDPDRQRSSARCCRRCSSGSPTRPTPTPGCSASAGSASASGSTHWYLKTLRDEGQVAERLARVLATSPLRHRPARARARRACGCSASDLDAAGRRGADSRRCWRRPSRQDDPEEAVRVGPRRSAAASCSGSRPATLLGADRRGRRRRRRCRGVTDATLEATLDGGRPVGRARSAGSTTAPTRMAVVAMGRYGGFELSYGSDADVLFVHEPVAGRRPARGARRTPRPWPTSCAGCSSLPGARPGARWSTPTCGPRASRGRWCARLDVVRRLLRQVVEGLGGAGAAARRRGGRRRGRCAGGSRS